MTHNELLAKINVGAKFHGANWSVDAKVSGHCDLCFNLLIKNSMALRAVVELHKPFTEFGDASCEACFNADYSHKEQPYPCQTIQAIEKELG